MGSHVYIDVLILAMDMPVTSNWSTSLLYFGFLEMVASFDSQSCLWYFAWEYTWTIFMAFQSLFTQLHIQLGVNCGVERGGKLEVTVLSLR